MRIAPFASFSNTARMRPMFCRPRVARRTYFSIIFQCSSLHGFSPCDTAMLSKSIQFVYLKLSLPTGGSNTLWTFTFRESFRSSFPCLMRKRISNYFAPLGGFCILK